MIRAHRRPCLPLFLPIPLQTCTPATCSGVMDAAPAREAMSRARRAVPAHRLCNQPPRIWWPVVVGSRAVAMAARPRSRFFLLFSILFFSHRLGGPRPLLFPPLSSLRLTVTSNANPRPHIHPPSPCRRRIWPFVSAPTPRRLATCLPFSFSFFSFRPQARLPKCHSFSASTTLCVTFCNFVPGRASWEGL